MLPELPVTEILSRLSQSLNTQDQAIVLAPPGAGKTSLIPLALLAEPWLAEQKIILLQPRRIAVRSVAARLAELLQEPVGERVGYRVRLETKVSARTQIEVMTEGLFLRMLHADPSLDGVGIVIFDECHERHLDTDLSLALVLNSRELLSDLREQPLKLLMMSATLDGSGLQSMLSLACGQAVEVIESQGRRYPVEAIYSQNATAPTMAPVEQLCAPIQRALTETEGSVLVFLPGVGEIQRLQAGLGDTLSQAGQAMEVLPLHGNLPLAQQRAVILPPTPGRRKIILATSIAQTSLTIEGITAVVDSGWIRVPKYDPRTGLTRLVTERISQATATQRAGRAGRLGPGRAYRAWPESMQSQLALRDAPEILSADLSAVMLQVIDWGADDVDSLHWLDKPPAGAVAAAVGLLSDLGAVSQGQITSVGQALMQIPASPRLACMLAAACDQHSVELAANLAALIGNKDPLYNAHSADIELRLALLNKKSGHQQIQRESRQLFSATWSQTQSRRQPLPNGVTEDNLIGYLLAHAYPDRIAKRGKGCHYTLANGRGVSLEEHDPLAKNEWIVVASLGGISGRSRDRVFLASGFDAELLNGPLKDHCVEECSVEWNENGRFQALRQIKLGHLILSSHAIDEVTPAEKEAALLAMIREQGLGLFTVSEDVAQWRARVACMARLYPEEQWPDVSDNGILTNLEQWFMPTASSVANLADIAKLNLADLLANLLVWPQPQQLKDRLPRKLTVPSGLVVNIDYKASPPVLAVKLQAMFGLTQTPSLADGRLPLAIHLLSPAGRPLQITQDLAGFWAGSYHEVRKELKGRYPKHPWPEDPATAPATHRAKPRK
ncbi:ATP-dependent helicase HrpB [Halioxenophilus aromaticivorans]|uniref:ATP-dependent helicase HrpB n=1 Tax=Halioxenophilus aromaticivorans TaxID=1306992 RepID=A0AAV3U347_9ALTE